ncbi:hypothetical protein ACLOJK_014823 [Asimina triloba]
MSSFDRPPANSHRLDPTSVAHPSKQQHRSASKLLRPSSKVMPPSNSTARPLDHHRTRQQANPHSNPIATSVVARSKQIQPPRRFEDAIHNKVQTHLAPSSGAWPTPVPRTDR